LAQPIAGKIKKQAQIAKWEERIALSDRSMRGMRQAEGAQMTLETSTVSKGER
jgi:hypothetical protein